jgi:hypothetical protein
MLRARNLKIFETAPKRLMYSNTNMTSDKYSAEAQNLEQPESTTT